MNAPFDRLHADLADLAEQVTVVDLRDRTLRTSRNLGIRRTLLSAAAVIVVVAIGTGAAFAVLPGQRAALPAGPSPSDQSTPTASATEAPSATASAATIAPSTSSSSGPSTSRCHTDELQVTMQTPPGGGAAGSVYTWLVFTNKSTRTCTLYGFPGVSYVTGPDGQQVNEPATRSSAISPARVTLDPGHAGYAQLQTGHPEAFPGTCKPVAVAGYRVYPPDETVAVFVSAPTQQCSTNGVNATVVNPISPLPTQ